MARTGNKRFYRRKQERIDALRKGVYILPNFLTSLSLFCGFYSIIATMQGEFSRAAWAVIISAVFDGLDGRIARLTHSTSRFGVEYDSLADLTAFGVAPGVLAYGWVLNQYGRWGWLAAFLFVACGAMRLARFNVQAGSASSRYFLGLPIPAAAGMVATTVLLCLHLGIENVYVVSAFMLFILYAMAFLMVSTLRYESFKNLDYLGRKPFNAVMIVILLICIVASEPQIILCFMAALYVFSGPVSYVLYLLRKKKRVVSSATHIEESNESNRPGN